MSSTDKSLSLAKSQADDAIQTDHSQKDLTHMEHTNEMHEEEEIIIPEAANALAPPLPGRVDDIDDADDDFGNQVDYQPKHGHGGIYREPMQGGNHWGSHGRQQHNHRHHRHIVQHQEQEGVLTIRQPGWKDRAESAEEEQTSDVLTIRRQGTLARSLRYSQHKDQTYISKPGRNNQDNRRSSQRGQDNQNRRSRRNQNGK